MTTPAAEDPNAAADAAVAGILHKPATGNPGKEVTKADLIDAGAKKTTRKLTSSKLDQMNKVAPPAEVEQLPFAFRKEFYTAVMYGDGRVTWSYPLGDAATDERYGVSRARIVLRSITGAEQQAIEAYMRRRVVAGDVPATDIYLLLARRASLLFHMLSYGEIELTQPTPDAAGLYKDEEVDAFLSSALRKLGAAQLAVAHKKFATFEKDLNTCVNALEDGSFSKAGS